MSEWYWYGELGRTPGQNCSIATGEHIRALGLGSVPCIIGTFFCLSRVVYVVVRICASGIRSCVSFGTDVVGGSIVARQRRNTTSTSDPADLGTSHADLAAARCVPVHFHIMTLGK